MKWYDRLIILLSLILLLLFPIIGIIEIEHLEDEVDDLKIQNIELNNQMIEYKEKCERMVDSCLDIVANRRWE